MVHDLVPTSRARRHDANLGRILDVAMELIAEGGIAGLSMGKLADAASYTPGALYRYFPSKDAILSRLVARTVDDVRARSDAAVRALPASASPFARVFALAHSYRAFAKAEPHRFGLLATTMAEPRVLLSESADAEPVARAMIAAMQPLAESLTLAASSELLDEGDVQTRTLCLFAMLHGLLQLQKSARRAPAGLDVDALVTSGVRTMLIGWGGKSRTVDAAASRASTSDVTAKRRVGAR